MTTEQGIEESQWHSGWLSGWLRAAKIGDAVETLNDNRACGGTVSRINVGTVERLTPTQVIVMNEHGNIQRFNKFTFESIPAGDRLSRRFFRKL